MSEPRNIMDIELPPHARAAADAYVQLLAQMVEESGGEISYADVMAGLLYALPCMVAIAGDPPAYTDMVVRLRRYVVSSQFELAVRQWAAFFKQAQDLDDEMRAATTNVSPNDLSKDPRFN